jgi:hypothetical protein
LSRRLERLQTDPFDSADVSSSQILFDPTWGVLRRQHGGAGVAAVPFGARRDLS